MRIHIGSDHAGLQLLRHVAETLKEEGHDVINHGPHIFDPEDDYPAFCIETAQAVVRDIAEDRVALGVVIGGSGNGEQIAANKVVGVRAALAWNEETARLAREHNNANVVSVGARQHSLAEATELVQIFVNEPFSMGERHERRIAQISHFETTGTISLESDAD